MSIQDIIANSFVLGNVEASLVVSGFASEMLSLELTAFPPWDPAFERLPYWEKVTRNRAWHGHVRDLLLGHFHRRPISQEELASGASVVMLNGDVAQVTNDGGRLRVDGNQVIASAEARDGFLYMLNTVREPPWAKRTVLDFIEGDGRFTILSQLLEHPSLRETRERLDTASGELTFFAPTDIALAGFDIDRCEQVDCAALLNQLVGNHVTGTLVSRRFSPAQQVTTQSGTALDWDAAAQTVSCRNADGSTESDSLNAFDEELALNGAVQPINAVLCSPLDLCDSTDSDGDGSSDCDDNCPTDSNKTEPGVCGCGAADSDADGDGALDCNDACPDDPAKTAPDICGCGFPDVDSDGDGAIECEDEEPVCSRIGDDVDLSNEPLANRYCCLCEGCDLPPQERFYRYLDSNQTTCIELEFDMFDMEPNGEVCLETKREYRELCCNTECTAPPPIEQEWEPVTVPLPFPPGDFPYCDICRPTGDATTGQYPLNPFTITTIATIPGNPSCADLYWMGRTNNIPAAICYPIQGQLREACGCAPPPDQGNEPYCDICPDGQVPLRAGAFLNDLPGNPMCGDLYRQGRTGQLSAEVCERVQNDPQDPCGCVPAE